MLEIVLCPVRTAYSELLESTHAQPSGRAYSIKVHADGGVDG